MKIEAIKKESILLSIYLDLYILTGKIMYMSDYLDLNNEELLKDFFSEAEQQVQALESNILVIETDPSNTEAIDEIFRAAHTLKGGSATVEMHELSGFTHVVEDLLDVLRAKKISVSEEVVDTLLNAIDVIKEMLQYRSNGSVYTDDVEPLKETLKSFIPAKGEKTKSTPPKSLASFQTPQHTASPALPTMQDPAELLSEYDLLELNESRPSDDPVWGITVIFDESNPMNSVGGIQVFSALKDKGAVLKTIPDFDVLYDDEFHEKVVYFISSALNAEQLEDAAFMDDVTLAVDAKKIDSQKSTFSSPEKSFKDTPTPTSAAKYEESRQEIAASIEAKQSAKEVTAFNEHIQEETDALEKKKKVAPTGQQTSTSSILRVDSKRIDYLLNLVSETVITKASFNQITTQMGDLQTQLASTQALYREKIRSLFDKLPSFIETLKEGDTIKDIRTRLNTEYADIFSIFESFDSSFKGANTKLRSASQNLGRIAGELQEGVMKIRMVPVNQIFSRFPRVIRDLSRDLDKKIHLEIEGEDTELDKSVIEDLLDPIMHCVRNSIDHGIERPEERAKKGKSEEGTVLLKASNEGNMIVIDIQDDGAGIDVEKVKQKAIERGLIHPNKILSDHEAHQLIFEAGFSTAAKVSNVSGRGVGLDVVKTQIEKLNGSVIVSSEPGNGTKFSIRLPLTLAIIQGLLIRVGKEVYSIPIASVLESHRVQYEDIQTIDNYEVFNVRNEIISVLRLNRLFGIKQTDDEDFCFIVIVGSAEKKIGIMVDALIGEEDVVIKPLRDQFTVSPGIAGASILGDGSVSLIIDVSKLLELGVKQELSAREALEIGI